MSNLDPIAYTYEADRHCGNCTEERFGRCDNGHIACTCDGKQTIAAYDVRRWPDGTLTITLIDSERNPVGVVAPWDEWWEPSNGRQTLNCGTCGSELGFYAADC